MKVFLLILAALLLFGVGVSRAQNSTIDSSRQPDQQNEPATNTGDDYQDATDTTHLQTDTISHQQELRKPRNSSNTTLSDYELDLINKSDSSSTTGNVSDSETRAESREDSSRSAKPAR